MSENEKLLNKEEIDSLLEDGGERKGIEAIINTSKVSYERLPMLEMIFDRMARELTNILRVFTGQVVEVNIDNIGSKRFGEFINNLESPVLLGVFASQKWADSNGIITLENKLIYELIDLLLGGGKNEAKDMEVERSYSKIEIGLVRDFFDNVMLSMNNSFKNIENSDFEMERIETNSKFVSIARPVNVVIEMIMDIRIGNRGGRVTVIIPYSSLETVRPKLLQMFMGERFGEDSIWSTHLSKELINSTIQMTCLVGSIQCSLGEIFEWKKGSQLVLHVSREAQVKLLCGKELVALGTMGKKTGKVAIKVDEICMDLKEKISKAQENQTLDNNNMENILKENAG